MNIADQIASVAQEFEGLTEIISNAEWDNTRLKGENTGSEFEKLLKTVGHQDGWPYCMSFCEAVWRQAYIRQGQEAIYKRVAGMLTPSVMNSFNECLKAGLITNKPTKGAIGFMQNGGSWQGHAFLVLATDGEWVHTIEANTSPSDANERDGGIGTGGVWRKRRILSFASKSKGLHLRGFINPLTA